MKRSPWWPMVRWRALAVAAPVSLVAACTPPSVDVPAYPIATSVRDQCATVVADLPGYLLDQGRRTVSPTGSQSVAAAWGDPAVVLTCAAPAPQMPATQVVSINGVDWRFWPLPAGYRFRAESLTPTIEITVPDVYDPAVDVITTLQPYLTD